MIVAIIPARGGSKRIPRKNIREFRGKPMMAWSIEAARESGCFDRVVVSTDDDEIADVAHRYGAEVPFRRPRELADDLTPTVPVIAHAIEALEATMEAVEYACCIYPTAPFVLSEDLKASFEVFRRSEADFVLACTTFDYPVQRALRVREGRIGMVQPEHQFTRSQDLEVLYHDAGQFYWGMGRAWCAGKGLLDPGSAPFFLPRHRVQDIDTEEDWQRAERMPAVERIP